MPMSWNSPLVNSGAGVADAALAAADEEREAALRVRRVARHRRAVVARERVAELVERRAARDDRLLERRQRLRGVDRDLLVVGGHRAAERRAVAAREAGLAADHLRQRRDGEVHLARVDQRAQALRPQVVAARRPSRTSARGAGWRPWACCGPRRCGRWRAGDRRPTAAWGGGSPRRRRARCPTGGCRRTAARRRRWPPASRRRGSTDRATTAAATDRARGCARAGRRRTRRPARAQRGASRAATSATSPASRHARISAAPRARSRARVPSAPATSKRSSHSPLMWNSRPSTR